MIERSRRAVSGSIGQLGGRVASPARWTSGARGRTCRGARCETNWLVGVSVQHEESLRGFGRAYGFVEAVDLQTAPPVQSSPNFHRTRRSPPYNNALISPRAQSARRAGLVANARLLQDKLSVQENIALFTAGSLLQRQRPCSYLVYSEAFDALPLPARDVVYRRLLEVLTGCDQTPAYRRLLRADRQAILEILLATKPGLSVEWER
jgi:hypothetical protein